ncbi:DUF692 domain-containing protein [Hydrogenophaga sp. 5NK40-0174]|uniref:MNIO family bufferin maturase n=1 Tax=Hydrogenophaga sp. 5NK40-0174 TaxID=3127649 RepID=UPI00310BAA34
MTIITAQPNGLPEVGIGWRHPHYQQLLTERPKLDFLEVHSENFFGHGGAALSVLEQGSSHYPVSLHGVGLSLGSTEGIDTWHLEQLAHLIERIDPVRVSDHASFARGLLHHTGVHAADLLPVPMTREALAVMSSNVTQVQDRLRRPIAVENLSAYVQWSEADMSETEFLTALAKTSGCQLLVDVNNIYVNACNEHKRDESTNAMDLCRRWLLGIAPDLVAEIHLAGHVDCGDIVIDDHGSRVKPAVWSLYESAVAHFGAVPTLIEWDTDIPSLETLLQEAEAARTCALQTLGLEEAVA